VASLSQGRTAAAQCGLFTHKSVPVIFEPPCIIMVNVTSALTYSAFYVHVSYRCQRFSHQESKEPTKKPVYPYSVRQMCSQFLLL